MSESRYSVPLTELERSTRVPAGDLIAQTAPPPTDDVVHRFGDGANHEASFGAVADGDGD